MSLIRLANPIGFDCFFINISCFCYYNKANFYSFGFLSNPGNLLNLLNTSESF